MSDDDFITISAGGKSGAFAGEPGVYTATLLTHTVEGPFDAKNPKPGDPPTFRLHEWGFVIDGAPEGAEMIWWTSGESTGPKSRTFAIITALFGGNPPPVGFKLNITEHLIGRSALLDIRRNDRGYLDVTGIMPVPKAAGAARAAAQPVAAGAVADSSLPF